MEATRLYERLIGAWLCEPGVMISSQSVTRPVSTLTVGRLLLLRSAFELGWEPVIYEFR